MESCWAAAAPETNGSARTEGGEEGRTWTDGSSRRPERMLGKQTCRFLAVRDHDPEEQPSIKASKQQPSPHHPVLRKLQDSSCFRGNRSFPAADSGSAFV